MCGLFGGASSVLSTPELELVFGLSTLSVFRGTDSSGLAFGLAPSAKKDKSPGSIVIYKDLLLANELFYRVTNGNRLVNRPDQAIRYVLGHARAATKGAVTKDNAHPFMFSNIVGAHNGTCAMMVPGNLTEEEKQTTKASDSWHIFNMLNTKPLDEVLERIRWGAFALTWIDRRDNTLNFIRNNERTLFFGLNHGTLYWASEAGFLEVMKARTRHGLQIEEVKPGVHYSLPLNFGNVRQMREVDKTKILRPQLAVAPPFHGHMFGSPVMDEGPFTEEALLEAIEEAADAKPETSVPAVFLKRPGETKGAKPEVKDESRVNSCRVLPTGEVVYKASFANAKSSDLVDTSAVMDFFRVIDSNGVIAAEPSDEEAFEILTHCNEEGCTLCGRSDVAYVELPRAVFFARDPENFKAYDMVCPTCVGDSKMSFIGYDDHALQIKPKYWRDKNG